MYLAHQAVGPCGEDGAELYRRVGVLPAFLEPRKGEGPHALHAKVERLLSIARPLPPVEAVGIRQHRSLKAVRKAGFSWAVHLSAAHLIALILLNMTVLERT